MRGELEGLLSSPPEEGARDRIDAAVAAFQAMRDATDGPADPIPAPMREEPDAPELPAVVVPFPPAGEEAPPLLPEPPPAPAWAAPVKENGRPARQASLFDQPHPVAPEPERRTATDKSWRKAVGGKPTQMSLF